MTVDLSPWALGLVALTIVVYAACRKLFLRVGHPLLSPVFLTSAILIAFLRFDGLTFDAYQPARDLLNWPLGVATVALAVPVYNNRARLRAAPLPLAIGALAGSLVTIAVVVGLAVLGHLEGPAIEA